MTKFPIVLHSLILLEYYTYYTMEIAIFDQDVDDQVPLPLAQVPFKCLGLGTKVRGCMARKDLGGEVLCK